VICLC